MLVSDFTERELIERVRRAFSPAGPAPSWLIVGIGDDAAVVEPERNRVEVLTVDAVVDTVHFDRRFTPPRAIGHRALAVNLSDIAAMGAEPRLALVSMALPSDLPCPEFDDIVAGIAALARTHRVHVVGGNLTRTPGPLTLDVTVVGTAKRRNVLTRAGARPGDEIYVTGAIGAAAAGLERLRAAQSGSGTGLGTGSGTGLGTGSGTGLGTGSGTGLGTGSGTGLSLEMEHYLYPQPRVKVGLLLGRNRAATACVDLSDGLGDGAHQIAGASAVGILIEEAAIPFGSMPDSGADPSAVMNAITAGDDYELLFTVRPQRRGRLGNVRNTGVPITRIGLCTPNRDVLLKRVSGVTEPLRSGFSHFR